MLLQSKTPIIFNNSWLLKFDKNKQLKQTKKNTT